MLSDKLLDNIFCDNLCEVLSKAFFYFLVTRHGRAMMELGGISADEYFNLTSLQQAILDNEVIYNLFIAGILSINEILNINQQQYWILRRERISRLIIRGKVTVDEALELSFEQVLALNLSPHFRHLISGRITLQQFSMFNRRQLREFQSGLMDISENYMPINLNNYGTQAA